MSWIITGSFAQPDEPEALAYIAAVEAADGQTLEDGVKFAYNSFIKGCKADGIWDAIKASCILAGARTLAGALVPLVGTAPTNFNFVDGDYNRETGLVGDGSTKYLDSNRAANAEVQNNVHLSVYRTIAGSFTRSQIGAVSYSAPNDTSIDYFNGWRSAVRTVAYGSQSASVNTLGFIAVSRSNASNYVFRLAQTNTTVSGSSNANTTSTNFFVFNRSGGNYYTDGALAFYSIGESLDLALLDARVTTLVSDLAAAIP